MLVAPIGQAVSVMDEALVVVKPEDTLRWWKDYWSFQPVLFRAIQRCPFVILYFIASDVISALTDKYDKLLRIPDGVFSLCLACVVVYETWSALTQQPRQDHKADYQHITSAWGNSIFYALAVVIGLLLLIVPGLYFLTAASLGIVFVCVEGMRAGPALDASRKLIQGNFFRSFFYLSSAPILLGLAVVVLYLVPIMLTNEAFLQSLPYKGMTLVLILATQWLILGVVPMQVNLYHFLKKKAGTLPKITATAPTSPKAEL